MPVGTEGTNHSLKETEQRVTEGALLKFYGLYHAPLNLQSVPGIVKSFEEFLNSPYRQKSLYHENPDLETASAARIKQNISAVGGLRHYVNVLFPTSRAEEITKRIEDVVSNKRSEAVDILYREFPPLRPYILPVFVFREVDRLRVDHVFEFDFESHTREGLSEIRRLSQKSGLFRGEALRFWEEGELMEGIGALKQSGNYIAEAGRTRKMEIVDFLKGRVRKLSKTKGGGAVFMLFGNDHLEEAETVQRKLMAQKDVVYDFSRDSGIKLLISDRALPSMPDQTVAQMLFREILMNGVTDLFLGQGKLTALADNYLNIAMMIDKVCLSYSMDEIDMFCRERIRRSNVVMHVQDNPLMSPVRILADK